MTSTSSRLFAIQSMIDAAYATALGEVDWHTCLDRFRAATGVGVSLTIVDTSGPHPACLAAAASGIDTRALEEFMAYYGTLNPWQPGIAKSPPGFAVSNDMLPREALVGSAFFQEWCRPWDIDDTAGVILANDRRANATVTFTLPVVSDTERQRVYDTVRIATPHLLRAYAVHERLQGAAEIGTGIERALAATGAAAFIVDADARILYATPSAEAVLSTQDGLVARDGRLATPETGSSALLASAIGRTAFAARMGAEGSPGETAAATVVIPRPAGRVPHTLILAPLPPAERSRFLLPVPDRVVIVIRAHGVRRPADPMRVAAHLRLSPAEASLACAIASGETLQSHAAKRGLSVETVRTQLRSAFSKTGCHRQSELVALVLSVDD